MISDYRNTKYCTPLCDLESKKDKVRLAVLKEHPKAKDMHVYISKNDLDFKRQFVEAYNGKCSYCGVSIDIIGWKQFEIDHFIPKESVRFKSKADAGYIQNLVLACYDCNRSKSDFELPDKDINKVNPDKAEISNVFIRDDDYYIRINNDYLKDEAVCSFYSKIGLENQIHRLDYLLLNMRGLRDSLKDKPEIYILLNEAIELIMKKRK